MKSWLELSRFRVRFVNSRLSRCHQSHESVTFHFYPELCDGHFMLLKTEQFYFSSLVVMYVTFDYRKCKSMKNNNRFSGSHFLFKNISFQGPTMISLLFRMVHTYSLMSFFFRNWNRILKFNDRVHDKITLLLICNSAHLKLNASSLYLYK